MEMLTTVKVKPRLAFIGVGWIGLNRLRSLLDEDCAVPVLVTDPNAEAVQRALELASGARRAENLNELLDSDIDGIVLATPSGLHAQQAILALDAGKHVFCQKPLGRTAVETKAVVEAAERNDRLLGVDFCYRHAHAMQTVRDTVRSGEIRDIFAVDLTFHNAYGPDKSWALDADLSGGGCLIDLGIHLIDLLYWTLGDVELMNVEAALYREGRRLYEPLEVEDVAFAELELTGGTKVRLACSWHFSAGRDAAIEAVFHGSNGSASFQNVDGSFYDFTAELRRGSNSERLAAPPDDWGGRAIASWAQRLGDDPSYDPAVAEAIQVAQTIDRMYGGHHAD